MDQERFARCVVHAILKFESQRQRLLEATTDSYLYVEGGPDHLAVLYELWHNRAHNVDGDGKTHPGRCACVGEDRSVHSNDTPLHEKGAHQREAAASSGSGRAFSSLPCPQPPRHPLLPTHNGQLDRTGTNWRNPRWKKAWILLPTAPPPRTNTPGLVKGRASTRPFPHARSKGQNQAVAGRRPILP